MFKWFPWGTKKGGARLFFPEGWFYRTLERSLAMIERKLKGQKPNCIKDETG